MGSYITDLALVSILVIGITAIMGVFANGVGERLFGGKGGSDIYNQDQKIKAGFKTIGGKTK